jgi:nucleoside-diphosphate-sugar epimerase
MNERRAEGETVLVTGANGFVGSAVLAYLGQNGYRAVGAVRRTSDGRRLSGVRCALRFADLDDRCSLAEAMDGCTKVVHCAARSLDWGSEKDFFVANVGGVRNVVEAASEAKTVGRIVFMSTANVAGFGKKGMTEEESDGASPRFAYSRTKLEGERAALELCPKKGIRTVILRPSAVYGPDDWKWSYEMIDRLNRSRWPLVDGGRAVFTPVFIENLCQAVRLALTCGETERAYNVTDDVAVSWRWFCERIAAALGKPPRVRSYPALVAYGVAGLEELRHRLFRPHKVPRLTTYRVIRTAKDFHYSCEKAKASLGYRPDTDIDAHIRKTVEWYRRATNGAARDGA